MPAFNAEKYIAESVESVLSQTYSNWELIIVDDGSTDGTQKIAQKYAYFDKRIKYIYQENGKQGKARNTGIKYSCGNFIAFLDADDLWHHEKLEKQISCMGETKADIVFASCYIFENSIKENLDQLLKYQKP